MRRNDAEQIGEMIRKFFRKNALEAPLNEYRLIQAWKDVVGPAITKYTSNLYIKNQILYVHITCAPTCLFRFFTNKSRPIINS